MLQIDIRAGDPKRFFSLATSICIEGTDTFGHEANIYLSVDDMDSVHETIEEFKRTYKGDNNE